MASSPATVRLCSAVITAPVPRAITPGVAANRNLTRTSFNAQSRSQACSAEAAGAPANVSQTYGCSARRRPSLRTMCASIASAQSTTPGAGCAGRPGEQALDQAERFRRGLPGRLRVLNPMRVSYWVVRSGTGGGAGSGSLAAVPLHGLGRRPPVRQEPRQERCSRRIRAADFGLGKSLGDEQGDLQFLRGQPLAPRASRPMVSRWLSGRPGPARPMVGASLILIGAPRRVGRGRFCIDHSSSAATARSPRAGSPAAILELPRVVRVATIRAATGRLVGADWPAIERSKWAR